MDAGEDFFLPIGLTVVHEWWRIYVLWSCQPSKVFIWPVSVSSYLCQSSFLSHLNPLTVSSLGIARLGNIADFNIKHWAVVFPPGPAALSRESQTLSYQNERLPWSYSCVDLTLNTLRLTLSFRFSQETLGPVPSVAPYAYWTLYVLSQPLDIRIHTSKCVWRWLYSVLVIENKLTYKSFTRDNSF